MANAYSLNNPYISSGNLNECIWRLTRTIKKAGWTVLASSDGTTKIAPAANNTDSWGNNANPLLDTYPSVFGSTSIASAPWIVLRGPSTLKIPITVAPTGTPFRGEKITQGAVEGEYHGHVFDNTSSSGWIVVIPRVGTFNSTDVITCPGTGTTFIPGGIIINYVREFMFAKSGSTVGDVVNHQIFYICADVVGENAQLFSTLATMSGCTAAIAPGCAATGNNAFPTLGIVARGVGGTNNAGNTAPIGIAGIYTYGSYHISATNIIGSTNVSPDGSFLIIGNNTASSDSTGGLSGFGYMRVDDGDPADVDPYVLMTTGSSLIGAYARTSNTGTATNSSYPLSAISIFNSLAYPFFGYQARGCPVQSRDVAAIYGGVWYYNSQVSSTLGYPMIYNWPNNVKMINHPSVIQPLFKENIMLFSPGTGSLNPPILKHYKGRLRWVAMISQGNMLDTFDGRKFICTSASSSALPAIVVGPWDGSTIPSP